MWRSSFNSKSCFTRNCIMWIRYVLIWRSLCALTVGALFSLIPMAFLHEEHMRTALDLPKEFVTSPLWGVTLLALWLCISACLVRFFRISSHFSVRAQNYNLFWLETLLGIITDPSPQCTCANLDPSLLDWSLPMPRQNFHLMNS